MWRERALRVVLVLVGLLFSAAIVPLIWGLRDPAGSDTGDTMMMSLYFTLGVFLLIAVRNPAAHRSVIAFAAWSSFAHAVTMSIQGLEMPNHAHRISAWIGRTGGDWSGADRAWPGKEGRRGDGGSDGVGVLALMIGKPTTGCFRDSLSGTSLSLTKERTADERLLVCLGQCLRTFSDMELSEWRQLLRAGTPTAKGLKKTSMTLAIKLTSSFRISFEPRWF